MAAVGAVDALGQQETFFNSGAQLQLTAPGYGVQTAWLGGGRVYFDGTHVVRTPADQNQLDANGSIVFRTFLINPTGIVDQVPANNRRTNSLSAPQKS